jgi:hypothetical protein
MSDIDNTFDIKNAWQVRQRDMILKPFFYDRYFPDRYRFLDNNDPTQRYVDTLVETPGGQKTVEEKIVHWPTDGTTGYTAFALETWTCTVPGYERQGWMYTSVADILIYAFSTPKSEVGLNVYVMDMQALKKWFWETGEEMWPITRTNERNRTECRVVPVNDVIGGGVKTKRYLIGPGWPDSNFCEVCCRDASWGYGVSLLKGKPGRWFCREHRPQP